MEEDLALNNSWRKKNATHKDPGHEVVDRILHDDIADMCSRGLYAERFLTQSTLNKNCAYHSLEKSNLLFRRENVPLAVKCELNGTESCALINTSVAASTVSMDVVEKLRITHRIQPPPLYLQSCYTKRMIRGVGTLDGFNVNFDGCSCSTQCIVVSDQHLHLILGLDFLDEFQVILDLESACMYIGGKHGKRLSFLNGGEISKFIQIPAHISDRCTSL